jgi:dipeptidyl aminopeptidase/acylaminoacyl peptidase
MLRTAAVVLAFTAMSFNTYTDVQPPAERRVAIELEDITIGARYYPSTTRQAAPAVVLLHGWSWPDNDPSMGLVAVAHEFQHAGYTVLVPTMRGWRPTGGADDCADKQVHDVLQALKWLGRQPEADADRLFLLGFSQGGQVALLAASHNAPVQAVAAFAPVVDPESWGELSNVAGIRDYVMEECGGPEGWQARTVIARINQLQQPLLLVHGDADKRVPTQQSVALYRKLDAIGHPVQLKLIPGAGHDQDAVLQPQFAIDFFRRVTETATQ